MSTLIQGLPDFCERDNVRRKALAGEAQSLLFNSIICASQVVVVVVVVIVFVSVVIVVVVIVVVVVVFVVFRCTTSKTNGKLVSGLLLLNMDPFYLCSLLNITLKYKA